MKILVAGSSGLIGSRLIPYLQSKGNEIFRLVRKKEMTPQSIFWDPEKKLLDPEQLENFDVVINLAGENIADSRWSPEKKEKFISSRVDSTALISQTLASLKNPPKVLINSSAIGFYGNKWDIVVDEDSPKGVGFLAELCKEWEDAVIPAEMKGIRVIRLRTGLVLDKNGGALPKMLLPFKFYLGGPLGGGEQYMSWITMDDLLEIVNFILLHEAISGPVNAVTPNPVKNEEFTKVLGDVLQKPAFLRMPEIALKLIFGEMAEEMFLSSTRALPKKLMEDGYKFQYPNLEEALRHVLNKESQLVTS